ncbi:adenylate cyclase [Leptospira yasudae]|uniref:Adenylate cyclase n=1 Tax=Leptospira yasudae TaxID=2202201 RepID=A0ABX9LXT1_9LEPT|nr:adenylate/guanylate cyclase domain-containing protein [Leptospira yasudae]RHX77659.1 adenylate cyclase [Leptospira yasudae]RHX95422.1 adenylate cyclase [Leptospira yasudae]TGK26171.1 adenylate/guanylate cyclase domain-containing protein [Leptospira yasudae]TGM08582.1 adenylate/guanylate cyclase domain-containing protein [Leptospira yasudae]TGM97970.1 adenylate/guanylate cyclase domain-containing protein [Leptospira yasudae]
MKDILNWLSSPSSRELESKELIETLNQKIIEAGIPVWRFFTSIPTMHPEVMVRSLIWTRGEETQVVLIPHDGLQQQQYKDSPIFLIREGARDFIRCKLVGPDADLSYPICVDLREKGGTDYCIFVSVFGTNIRSAISWTTDAPGGFTDEQIESLNSIRSVLSLRLDLESRKFAVNELLEVYLGPNASKRVLSGEFMRGTGETIYAAILCADLRDFSSLSENNSPKRIVEVLDHYFELTAQPIQEEKGEILKFIGDAILAVFPAEENDPHKACLAALNAARKIQNSVTQWNAEHPETQIHLGMALNVGDVVYGNVGAKDRLDFTVIGNAVNQAFRVESLCKDFGKSILTTEEFANKAGKENFEFVGARNLKGITGERNIYSPRN